MTSSSLSKIGSLCIFYDVFDVGVFVGSSFIEVSHLYIIDIFILPLLIITNKLEFAQFGALVVLNPTLLSLLNSELVCASYGSFFLWTVFSAQAVVLLGTTVVLLRRYFCYILPLPLPLILFFWCLCRC